MITYPTVSFWSAHEKFMVNYQFLESNSSSSAMETRLCVVGKENGDNQELMQAIEVNMIVDWSTIYF